MTSNAIASGTTVWRLLRRAISLVLVLCLLGVVATFAVFAVPQLIGGEHSFVVLSGSMEPTMAPGDVIIVDDVGIGAIETGDIVTFRGSGTVLTTHRVVDVIRDGEFQGLETKGDSNEDVDQGLVRPSQLVGRVMTVDGSPIVIPYAGLVIETARTQMGVYALLFVPLTLFVLNEIYTQLRRRSVEPASTGAAGADGRHWITGGLSGSIGAHAVAEGVDVSRGGGGTSGHSGAADDPLARRADPGAGAGTLSPLDAGAALLGLVVLVPYAGWMTMTHRSVLSAMIFAGSAVGLVLVGYVRYRLWRTGARSPSRNGIAATDLTLTILVLAVLVPYCGWLAISIRSVPSAMLAAGGGVALVLLLGIRLRLRFATRSGAEETDDDELREIPLLIESPPSPENRAGSKP